MYRIYIDESGNDNLGSKSIAGNSKYFCLIGVIMDYDHVRDVFKQVEDVKEQFFSSHPDNLIVLHRRDIVSCNSPFYVLKKQETREHFDNAMLHIYQTADYAIIAILVDKELHKRTYVDPHDPYELSFKYMMERYSFYLKENHSRGDVLVEKINKATNGKMENTLDYIRENGTAYLKAKKFNRIDPEIIFKEKRDNIAGLQLADMLVNVSKKDIQSEYIGKNNHGAYEKQVSQAIHSKYYRDSSGRVRGCGMKFFPKIEEEQEPYIHTSMFYLS